MIYTAQKSTNKSGAHLRPRSPHEATPSINTNQIIIEMTSAYI